MFSPDLPGGGWQANSWPIRGERWHEQSLLEVRSPYSSLIFPRTTKNPPRYDRYEKNKNQSQAKQGAIKKSPASAQVTMISSQALHSVLCYKNHMLIHMLFQSICFSNPYDFPIHMLFSIHIFFNPYVFFSNPYVFPIHMLNSRLLSDQVSQKHLSLTSPRLR